MDWSKAKTVLIVAFIITNVFLFYNVEKADEFSSDEYSLARERIEDVKNLLEDRGIAIEGEIPRGMPELPSLEVAYEELDADSIAQALLGDFVSIGDAEYSKGSEKLMILDEKLIVYENTEAYDGGEPGHEEAMKIAEAFLAENGFTIDDALLQSSLTKHALRKLSYSQVVEGLPLENGTMEFLVSDSGVAMFERAWMEVIDTGETARKVIPATKALLKASEALENSKRQGVSKIQLTYLFDTKKTSLSKWQDIKLGTALPVWRLDLADGGEPIYIDAYEGIVIGN